MELTFHLAIPFVVVVIAETSIMLLVTLPQSDYVMVQ